MKKYFLLIVFYFLIGIAANLSAQNLSFNIGSYFPNDEYFKDDYKSHIGLAIGSTVGIPLSNNFSIYGKVTYFFISGTPLIQEITYTSAGEIKKRSYRDGTASFKEFIFNLGIQYHIFSYRKINFLINSGLVYGTDIEDRKSSDGKLTYHEEGIKLLGLFGGISAERQIGKSNLSILSELQYDYSLLENIGDYGGIVFSFGIKYYFRTP